MGKFIHVLNYQKSYKYFDLLIGSGVSQNLV